MVTSQAECSTESVKVCEKVRLDNCCFFLNINVNKKQKEGRVPKRKRPEKKKARCNASNKKEKKIYARASTIIQL